MFTKTNFSESCLFIFPVQKIRLFVTQISFLVVPLLSFWILMSLILAFSKLLRYSSERLLLNNTCAISSYQYTRCFLISHRIPWLPSWNETLWNSRRLNFLFRRNDLLPFWLFWWTLRILLKPKSRNGAEHSKNCLQFVLSHDCGQKWWQNVLRCFWVLGNDLVHCITLNRLILRSIMYFFVFVKHKN